MATLLLSAAGTAVGGALGGPLGATIGRAAGAIAGSIVDQAIIGALTPARRVQGPRLTSVDITASTEGAAITRLFGRSRLAGQMIWATRFEEEISKETTGGGKGFSGPKVTTTTYAYYANFAVALCEGPVTRIGRIWMDGRELDQTQATVRSYLGTEDQSADSLIVAKEGADNAPAYRGVAYVVFERLPLEEYGNRMPVVTAEVFRAVGDLDPLVKGVALIPGSTEFGYEPAEVTRKIAAGSYAAENRHTTIAKSDFAASLDLLQDVAPNAGLVNLVAAWFGDDLRASHCTIRPKVENATKETRKAGSTFPWTVAGLTRSTAEVMSQIDGGPAFGGSPNDASLIAGIQDLKARGLRVMVYPFIMMDIPPDNALPDPYSDNAGDTGQAAYPWRGRITVSPAAGFAGSPDKSAAAGDQVSDFLGTASAADFSGSSGTTVTYTGPAEWSYRRFILHMAKICQLAGGVDLFCIGSEMLGMTRARDGATSYPFVAGLIDLAGEVRSMLPAARIGYAADWSEYHSHRPDDGTGDVLFNLDPLWSAPDVDFIGIDNYLPLADWRDGTEHLDYSSNGPTTIYDADYLKGNIEGGEYYDWYYPAAGGTGNEPSPERLAQSRIEIVDGDPAAEHWVFRQKDMKNWWSNAHHDRPGGTRSGSATSWTPESKPVIFTELGCPAVDKGANQPNVFFDPKSSESFLPYFSSGARDDAMQRAFLEASISYWEDVANNPDSSVYAGRMIETASTCIWSWDARMAPSFPDDEATWADAPNWELGHWISGRLGAASGAETFAAIMEAYGFADYSVEPLGAVVDGVLIDRIMSARDVVDAIVPAYFAYAVESQGAIRFRSRRGAPVDREVALDDLVDLSTGSERGASEDLFARRRAQETELPAVVKLGYGEPTSDDLAGAVEARR
ncbi:MAG: baseplate multidomain protein megatron, partial [Hyphomicrobiales bacterium]